MRAFVNLLLPQLAEHMLLVGGLQQQRAGTSCRLLRLGCLGRTLTRNGGERRWG